ncbi:MAG: nucleoside triphosphate pyrophosphohydrolase family protein [Ktedonobacterales bacterium]|nr:nucleoside triphosphate pyrophosphohydrolase family protein [Ktedonobacterales bacterium]
MDFETYRRDVLRTARAELTARDRLLIGGLGLCGEAGEVAEALKKALFHDHPLDTQELCDELGDVLWYWVFLCETLGLSPDEVVASNIEKRRKRYPEGFSAERSQRRDDAPPRGR